MVRRTVLMILLLMFATPTWSTEAGPRDVSPERDAARASARPRPDSSGTVQRGEASYYSHRFAGKPMADGTPMDPESNAAASPSLPLGTEARVTNLENGRSAVVEIRDRGPYVEGRIIDVTPKTAEALGFTERGVVPVEVEPINLPRSRGRTRSGSAD